jgi:uncharacterized protein DUF4232
MCGHRSGLGIAAARAAWLALATAFVLGPAGCSSAPSATAPSGPATSAPSSAPAGPGPGPSTPTTTDEDVPACGTSTLAVTLGPCEGAAGTIYAPVRFTNTATRPCHLRGFPGVSYVTGDRGDQVGHPAVRDGAPGGAVTLAPGAVASASLAMVQVANFDPAACRPTPVRGLRVYPPDERASAFIPLAQTGCAGDPPGPQLRIGAIKPGRGPS